MRHPSLAPGAPRPALGVALTAGLGVLVGPWVVPGPGGTLTAAVSFLVLLTCTGLLVRWRMLTGSEHELWSKTGAGLVVVAASIVAAVAGTLAGVDQRVLTAVQCVALVAVMSTTYLGLIRWTRPAQGRRGFDPDHLVNAVCGVVVLVTALQLLLHQGSEEQIQLGPDLPLLVAAGCSTVVAVVLVLTTRGAWRRGDPRPALLVTAMALMVAGTAAILVLGLDQQTWLLMTRTPWPVALVVCAALPVVPRPVERVDVVLSTVTGYAVVAVSLPVVAVAHLQGLTTVAVVSALAGAGSAVRLLLNVRELHQLVSHRRDALTDELTGLPNRRALTAALERSVSERREVVVAVIDLDHFKGVNDALGHGAGDVLLCTVADRMRGVLRPGELVARLGGDEFVIHAPVTAGTAEFRAAQLGAATAAALAAPVDLGQVTVHVNASTGTAVWRHDPDPAVPGPPVGLEEQITHLLRCADTAMYDAKRSGTGWAPHDPALHDDHQGQLALVGELRTALTRRQLVLHYQPQVATCTGAPVGVEALVRWAHPQLGLLLPARFLDLVEHHGLMGLLTEEVLRLGIAQHGTWRRAGLRVRMSLNLPASALRDVELPERVGALLAEHGVLPEDVVLEVTESLLLRDPARSAAVVHALRASGVGVSIDDFGTGYSSLARLRHLPVDELKLDRSFTSDLLVDERTATIVDSTVKLAHALGLRVVAEGVEDEATLQRLGQLGCDEAQGYLLAAPMPAAEVAGWWRRASARAVGAGLP